MSTTDVPSAIHKTHAGMSYSVTLKSNDSKIYLDIDELGLHDHEVHTKAAPDMWSDLEREADKAAFTIIDLHNASPKGLL
ncbi:MAG: hypothetical protein EOO52_10375 [Gammaproteobacteria bacterium]|nr:MAG: hypothetical protein EOO52_10375 [Gammaproteobacteria bacterium]